MKHCTKCGIKQSLKGFYKLRDKLMSQCVTCTKQEQAAYRIRHREEIRSRMAKNYHKVPAEIRSKRVKYRRLIDGVRIRRLEKVWRKSNRDRINPIRAVQKRAKYKEHRENVTETYAAIRLNSNRPVYINRQNIPKSLLEAKQYEIRLRQLLKEL